MLLSGGAEQETAPAPFFEEVPAAASRIAWVHENARSETHYLPETMGPGIAFLDYDQDGLMDIYLINSGLCDFYKPPKPLGNALYRNNGDGTFTDVAREAGVLAGNFGTGIAAADYDNDGDTDIFLTAYGTTILYRNLGNGKFEDATLKSGLAVSGWTTSAVWFDYDNDGFLDLFICNYVVFGVDKHISCGMNALGKAYYCVPRVFDATSSLLFRNRRDGTFEDAGRGTAIESTKGKAMGAVAADVNNDARMDLFVANDTMQDYLFLNREGGKWEEAGLFAGVGFSADGQAQSGMGVDAADFDGDGWQVLLVANIDHQNYSLFRNNGDESFTDVAIPNGIAKATFLLSGWGLKFLDVDNDGDLDLFLANGHPDDMIAEYAASVTFKEPLRLFENSGGRLADVSGKAGPVFRKSFPARGLAAGDYDNDGRVDIVVSNNGEAPLLLHNRMGAGNGWLGVRLQGVRCNRDGIGARLTWSTREGVRSRVINAGGSYMSSHDPRQILGLGKSMQVDWLEIQWPMPSGKKERLTGLTAGKYLTIREGEGVVAR